MSSMSCERRRARHVSRQRSASEISTHPKVMLSPVGAMAILWGLYGALHCAAGRKPVVSLNGIESSFVGVMHVSSDVERLVATTGGFTVIARLKLKLLGPVSTREPTWSVVHGVTVH